MDKDINVWPGFNASHDALCPICRTNKNVETVLVPIPGTERDGIVEAKQVHLKCYKLMLEMSAPSKSEYKRLKIQRGN